MNSDIINGVIYESESLKEIFLKIDEINKYINSNKDSDNTNVKIFIESYKEELIDEINKSSSIVKTLNDYIKELEVNIQTMKDLIKK